LLLFCCSSAVVCSKVCTLEAEAHQLQSSLMQSQQTVKALERRLAGAEAELVDQQQRVRAAMCLEPCPVGITPVQQ
jgi:predicted RNase H-like nuclease (RuvC/YqgF family)